jgi:AraC-like DNA-binding protein
VKLSLNPALVPDYIDGFVIQSDFWMSRFSALASPEARREARAEHSRVELELNLALRGRADYLVGDQRVALEARQMLWLLPHQKRLVIDASQNFSAWVLVFRPRLVRRVCTTEPSRPLRDGASSLALLRRLAQAEVDELSSLYASIPLGEGRDTFNAGLAYALTRSWSSYLRASAGAASSDIHPAVQRAAWLLRDASEVTDSTELAARVGLSRERLSRLFKAQMGVPLVEFRNRQRLEHFLRSLDAAGAGNLLEGALAAGFGSYAQFHRIFKQHVGCSPSRYVQKRKRLDVVQMAERLGKSGGSA